MTAISAERKKILEEDQMDAKWVSPIAHVIGHSGDLVNVRSNQPSKEFQRGGSMFGYRQEWGYNHATFTEKPETIKALLSLSNEEYENLEKQYTHIYNHETQKWENR